MQAIFPGTEAAPKQRKREVFDEAFGYALPNPISMYEHQAEIIKNLRRSMAQGNKRVILRAATGLGKCHGIDTPILMADGTIRMVQDVTVGDQLMGPDGQPRNVLALGRGRDQMYRIVPVKGDPYTVNSAHILSLKKTPSNGTYLSDGTHVPKDADVVNVNVEVFMRSSATARHLLKGWRAGEIASFGRPDCPLPVPAYIVGAYLGDGSLGRPEISKPDCNMVQEWLAFGRSLGATHSVYMGGSSCPTWSLNYGMFGPKVNHVTNALRAVGILNERRIPDAIKYGSTEARREVLAGLIDADGHDAGGVIDLVAKDKALIDDVVFVARSLGLAAYQRVTTKGIKSIGFVGEYHRAYISGDLDGLPMRDKVVAPRLQKKRHLVTGIKVEPIGEDDYYGFELDGDHLYLLGDFTVTHNTRISAWIALEALRKGRKTLFIVRGRGLVSQAHRSYAELGIPVSILMAGYPYDRSCPIQVASVDTLDSRMDDLDWFEPDLIVTDECRESITNTFNKVRERWPNAYEVGLDATPSRPDGRGMGEVYDAMVSAPDYQWLIENDYLVKPRYFSVVESESQLLKVSASGEFTEASGEAAFENVVLVGGVVKHWLQFAEDRPTVVFASTVAHSIRIMNQFNEAGISAAHVDANTPDEDRQRYYDDLATGELKVICNYGILHRGWDVTAVSCVILVREVRHISNFIQMIGRGLRKFLGKIDCIVLDLGENVYRHGCFVESPVPWSLDGQTSEEEVKERERSKPKEIVCSACHFVYSGRPACPNCGHAAPPKADDYEGEERDATVTEVKLTPTERAKSESVEQKRAFYEELLGWCMQNGKKAGFAYYAYKDFYGIFPAGVVQKGAMAEPPSIQTQELMSKRQRAWFARNRRRKS